MSRDIELVERLSQEIGHNPPALISNQEPPKQIEAPAPDALPESL